MCRFSLEKDKGPIAMYHQSINQSINRQWSINQSNIRTGWNSVYACASLCVPVYAFVCASGLRLSVRASEAKCSAKAFKPVQKAKGPQKGRKDPTILKAVFELYGMVVLERSPRAKEFSRKSFIWMVLKCLLPQRFGTVLRSSTCDYHSESGWKRMKIGWHFLFKIITPEENWENAISVSLIEPY